MYPGILAHVSVLSLDGLSSLSVSWLPAFPALERLKVVSAAAQDGSHCTPLALSLQCPSLCEIVLVRPVEEAAQAPWLLRADLVLGFLAKHPARGVGSLIIRGAQLVAPGMDDLRACNTRVEEHVSAQPLEPWVHNVDFERVLGFDLA